MFAVVPLLLLVALFLTVARVAAVALEATGMARDSAQFQSRSALRIVERPLSELHLTKEGVGVLGIHRKNGAFVGTPTGDTVIHDGDAVLVYGRDAVLHGLARRSVETGDREHEEVAAAQQALLNEEE